MSNFKKAKKCILFALLVFLLVLSGLTAYLFLPRSNIVKDNPDVYVGVAFGGNTTAEGKFLIDRVSAYTNLFVLASGGNPISKNQTSIEEICDYAVAKDLNIIINVGTVYVEDGWFWKQESLESIMQRWNQRWGDKFLGMYYGDEFGGFQLDGNWTDWFLRYGENLQDVGHPSTDALYNIYNKMFDYVVNGTEPQDYDLEANFFVENVVHDELELTGLKEAGVKTFMSDYGLFWFDFLGGYDVIFTQLGWNNSVSQQIALIKGAARMQNKDWGAIVTWKYDEPEPDYLGSGAEIYNQMLASYQAGAKYVTIFNYPKLMDNDYGIMKDEHFIALEKFWKTITQDKTADLSQPEAVLVLPRNYGWGMRHPNDTIWGFWPADEESLQTGIVVSNLLAKYGALLDIVYDDPSYPVAKINYKNIYYWNSTQI